MTTSTQPSTAHVTMMHHGQAKIDIDHVLKTTTEKNILLSKSIRYLSNFKPSDPSDFNPSDLEESEESYLQKLRLSDVQRYFDVSEQIMEKLDATFQGSNDSYLPWLKYFTASNQVKVTAGYTGEALDKFIEGISELTTRLLLKDGKQKTVDWRIAKQILVMKRLFDPRIVDTIEPQQLVEAVLKEVDKASEQLVWPGHNHIPTIEFTKRALANLKQEIVASKDDKKVLNAVISGRFDKADFSTLGHTLILGEDGGLFLLLNSVNLEEKKILDNAVSSDYLLDKVSGTKKTDLRQQIVIGKGGFGKVRFAVSLFIAKTTNPSDIICIKKTGSFAKLNADMRAKQELRHSAAEQVIEATFGDYFTGDIAKVVYSPAIVDMAIVMSKDYIKKPVHQKGYLMMEILPQNTGNKIFQDPQYQKWGYQKPYLIDVFEGVNELLARKVAMTDLKPENTLYDKDTRQATIIDLGGAVEVADLATFDTRTPFQSTPGYQAPELLEEGIIDIRKALAYSCGKILQKITDSEGFTTDYNKNDIKQLINKLTEKDPKKRLSINEALTEIKNMDDDSYKQQAVFSHYINKLKEKLTQNKASLSINDNIDETRKLYLDQEVTDLDSYKYKKLKRENLMAKIEIFFQREAPATVPTKKVKEPEQEQEEEEDEEEQGENAEEKEEEEEEEKEEQDDEEKLNKLRAKQVFLLLGAAGSGKSIALQLKFIEAVNRWQSGRALPVYFNLANEVDLTKILTSMNQLLGTKITLKELHNQQVDLYVDSYDEGIGVTRLKERDTLINNYIKQISTPQGVEEKGLGGDEESRRRKIKVLVSCRSDYLQNDSDDAWFAPKAATKKISSSEVVEQPQMNLLEKWYIAPITYKTQKELKTNIRKYLNYLNTQTHASAEEVKATDVKYDAQWYQKQIQRADLKTSIDTGFMFYMVMETLPSLHSHTITKQDIYRTYVNLSIARALKMSPWTPEQLQQIKHTFANYDDQHFFDQLGRYIAGQLHTSKQFRFDQTSMLLLQGFGYRKDVPFRQQMAFYLLRVLPLKIEIKLQEPVVDVPGMHSAFHDQGDVSSIRYEEITIGFTNDTLKNYYLVQAIEHELKETRKSPLLASRDIVKDKLLMSHLFEAVEQGPQAQMWQQTLLQAVLRTKSDKSAEAITCAANAITLLNLLQNVLPAQDLSNTNIRGANLRNGWLQYTDFTGADLTNVNLSNAHLTHANLAKANLSGVNLSISPDLAGGLIRNIHILWKLEYSPDGKHLATYSATFTHDDATVIIWDQATNKKLNTLTGQLLTFSPNGKTIATASPKDQTLTIWDVATAKQLHTFNGSSLSYSPNNQTLAVLSNGGDMVQVFTADYKLLVTLKYDGQTTTLSYSPDGKTIATGSNDSTKVWDVTTGNLLDTLTGDASKEVVYSPDGKTLVAYSSGYQLKLWDVATRKEILNTGSFGFKYSPDGKVIANSFGNQLELWDLTADEPLATQLAGHSTDVRSLSFSPDSKALVTAASDNTIKIWDIVTGKQLGANLAGHSLMVCCLSYSSDGKTVAAGLMDNTVKIWSTSSTLDQLEATRNGHTQSVNIVSYSPDGTTIATAGWDSKLKFWHSATGRQLRTDWNLIKAYGSSQFRFCYSPDSRTIATGREGKMSIWDVVTGKLVGEHIKLPSDYEVWTMSYSPDSKILAIGLTTGNVMLWDAVTQKQLKKDLQGHSGYVWSLSFSPDGKILASGGDDKVVRLWDVAKHTQIGNPLEGHAEFVKSVSFSPDGKIIASGSNDKTIRLWDVAKHIQIGKPLEGHTSWVNSISFSGDGRILASGSHDETVRLWDVTKQTQIGDTLKAHTGMINSVSFSRDGKNVVSGANDHSVKIWGEKNGKWLVIRDLHAVESPLLADDMIIEGAVLSEQNKQVFEQRKCKEGQNTILPAKQQMIDEEQKDTLYMTEFTRKLETELFAKFKHQNGQTSSDLTGNNNNQRSQSTNLINLQISALSQPAKKTQSEQAKSELNAKSKQQDSQPPSAPISNNNNQRSQSNNLSTLQDAPNQPEKNTQSEQAKPELNTKSKQQDSQPPSGPISDNNNQRSQSNNLSTLQDAPNQPEKNTQSEQARISGLYYTDKQQSQIDHNITSPPFGTDPRNTQITPLYPAEQKLEPEVVESVKRSNCCETF